MANYLEDRELYYEMKLSKGMGKLTRKAQNMLILIANQTIRKKESSFKENKDDALQSGLLHMFSNWKSFNPAKFDTAFPYFTEIFKRGLADGINIVNNKKNYNDEKIVMISIDRSNDGNGLHSF